MATAVPVMDFGLVALAAEVEPDRSNLIHNHFQLSVVEDTQKFFLFLLGTLCTYKSRQKCLNDMD
jgi:hypothetical protein